MHQILLGSWEFILRQRWSFASCLGVLCLVMRDVLPEQVLVPLKPLIMIILFPAGIVALNLPLVSIKQGICVALVAFLSALSTHLAIAITRSGLYSVLPEPTWAGLLGLLCVGFALVILSVIAVKVRMRYWPLVINNKCPKCGYQLIGLTTTRCPECGRSFDPAQLTVSAAWRQSQAAEDGGADGRRQRVQSEL